MSSPQAARGASASTAPSVVFVTGASSGIGAAIARRLAAAGSRLVLAARRADRLRALAESVPTESHVVALDVRDRAAVDEAVRALPAEFREVDCLVNNAGLALGLDKIHDADVDHWEQMIDTNVNGVLNLVRALLPSMVARRRGHVVNLGSVAALYPYAGGAVYGATKAFVMQLSLMMRADLHGTGVRVTDIEPGMVGDTEFSTVRLAGDAVKAREVYRGMTALGPDDVAECVAFCACLPAHVNVNRLELMPTAQSFAGFAVARE